MPEITHDPVTVVRAPQCCDSEFVVKFVPCIESTIWDGNSEEIVIDLSRATVVNSASLGAFLLLRDRARDAGRRVALVNANSEVRKALQYVGFDHLFEFR